MPSIIVRKLKSYVKQKLHVAYQLFSIFNFHFALFPADPKKLLDTKTLTVKESGWIDFDIQKAVKAWIGNGANYGIEIEVENEDNDLVDVTKYFSNLDCPIVSSEFMNYN